MTYRTRFAWFPVRLHRIKDYYIEPTNSFVWWKPVFEVLTIWGKWIAYEHNQHGIKGDA
jgi:hypothetical protein